MTTIQHDGIVELVRQHPRLVVDLLRHVGTFALPDDVDAVLGSEDMTDVTPRANGKTRRKPGPQKYTADSVVVISDRTTKKRLLAVVVEPQGKWADEKGVSWPVYATTARKANQCPRAVVITVCWDRAEAEGCRQMIATGHPGLVFIPVVISADDPPVLDDAKPYLTLVNAVIGAVDLDTAKGRSLAVEAIAATGASESDQRTLGRIILGVASDTAYEQLEDLMAVSFNEKYKNKFIDDLFDRREAELKRAAAEFIAEGKAEGKAEGEARARIDSIRRVLKSRGLRPSRAERELIESCTDLNTLVAWFDHSLTATKVSDIFED